MVTPSEFRLILPRKLQAVLAWRLSLSATRIQVPFAMLQSLANGTLEILEPSRSVRRRLLSRPPIVK